MAERIDIHFESGQRLKARDLNTIVEAVNGIKDSEGFLYDSTNDSIAEGENESLGVLNTAAGVRSHAEGIATEATNEAEHAEGKYNVSHNGQTIHSIGIGTDGARQNAVEVMNNGDVYINGMGNYNGNSLSDASSLQTYIASLVSRIATLESWKSSVDSSIADHESRITALEGGGPTPPTPPTPTETMHYWFASSSDAEANGVTIDTTMFTEMTTSSGSGNGSFTIDDKTYTLTKRTGDPSTFGKLTIPDGKTATVYVAGIASGASARTIVMSSDEGYRESFNITNGSSAYTLDSKTDVPAGTYTLSKGPEGNVRIGAIVVKCSVNI